jgi:hypothetical protein
MWPGWQWLPSRTYPEKKLTKLPHTPRPGQKLQDGVASSPIRVSACLTEWAPNFIGAIVGLVNIHMLFNNGQSTARSCGLIVTSHRGACRRHLRFCERGHLFDAHACQPGERLGRAAGSGGGRNAEADFHGQKRSNETHASECRVPSAKFASS